MANRIVTKDVSDSVIAGAVLASFPLNKNDRIIEWKNGTTLTIKGSNLIPLRIGDYWFLMDTDVDVTIPGDIDTLVIGNGDDFFVYACNNAGTLEFKFSTSSTFPLGFDTSTSRKIGGVHTLCEDVGIIPGHTLSGFSVWDLLPQSVWDLKHRPICEPAGMVYSEEANIWVDIYLQSGTGVNTLSKYAATIMDTRNWMDHVDDLGAVGKRLLTDYEFQLIAAGSPEETNLSGSADPITTGKHTDTLGIRIISNIGCEDCCGVMDQWLLDQCFNANIMNGWGWYNLSGGKGGLWNYNGSSTPAEVKLIAGGHYMNGSNAGSRCRKLDYAKVTTSGFIGARGCCRGI